jgi:hypothetical protein
MELLCKEGPKGCRSIRSLEGIHIPKHRRPGHEAQVERCPAWLCSQPGYKVAHRRQPEVMVTMLTLLETSMS